MVDILFPSKFVVICLLLDNDLPILKEVERRGIKVAVAGIPKTIDNDIAVSSVNMISHSDVVFFITFSSALCIDLIF